jgi:hypothetical protein
MVKPSADVTPAFQGGEEARRTDQKHFIAQLTIRSAS